MMNELSNQTVFISGSPEDTEKLGARLARALEQQRFVAFYGTLGAGKTAFIRGMASVICPAAPVQSPTYTIINEYKKDGRTALVHVDAYRINDDDDLYSTGFYDCVEYENCVFAVEWCEKIPFAVPEDAVTVTIEYIFDGTEERIPGGEENYLESMELTGSGKRRITVGNLRGRLI
ncbi:MAG: tRNA (adenosine(37)-N6)-threonylcarbamoyltransferase complex ATPase subunit type 1 TsaE [Clostridia bacterium]|nr:tRNA (adenosine(37)-N6)-threonylcarbamoyltransferase complex ATPase subunit type 1 TsaE [Clostridia bacterium]